MARPVTLLLLALLAPVALTALISCASSREPPTLVLYSTLDAPTLRRVADAYQAETGVRVLVQGEAEGGGAPGLGQRLVAEASAPRADVWWSDEPFDTIRLARAGVLEPYTPATLPDSWPAELRGRGGLWMGLGLRARVIAYDTQRVPEAEAPRRLRDLAGPRWAGRVGIARPREGTTRGHMGALAQAWGAEELEAWLREMAGLGLRVYDDNERVVRGVALGEIDLGLTDSDAVLAAQARGWPVGMVFEALEPRGSHPRWSIGAMGMPTTVALVAGGPNAEEGRRFLDWLCAGRGEAALAASAARLAPIDRRLAGEFPGSALPGVVAVDLEAVADAIEEAMAVTAEVFP